MKYGPYKGVMAQSTNASDIPLMRVEEMYLILAEAQAMGGNPSTGAATLQKFVNDYRDPAYVCTASSATAVQDAVWQQRRIELWGEFGRIYDIRRLKQGFRRTADMGWPSSALIAGTDTEDPESYAWVLTIPQTEFDGNPNMDPSKDQNPIGDHK